MNEEEERTRQAAMVFVGQVIDERYRLKSLIGSGGNASVYHAEEINAAAKFGDVAVKLLFQDTHGKEDILGEVTALKENPHPNVIGFRRAKSIEINGRRAVYLAMELASETLLSMLGALTEAQAEAMTVSIAKALAFLHSKGMVHNDVKPANIFAIKDTWKLGDFGLARRADFAFKDILGTLPYAAPEIVSENKRSGATDVYALGAVLFECLTKELVYPTIDRNEFTAMLRTQSVVIPMTLAPRWRGLLASCLARRPEDRCTALEIAQRLWPTLPQRVLPRAPQPAQTLAAEVDGHVVSAMGNAKYRTIGEAVKNAKAGERILVMPGHYPESLFIDKPIHLIGQGPVQEIIIESNGPNTLHLQGDDIHVQGITVHQKATPAEEGFCAVLISAGKPRLQRCHLRSDALACLGVCGENTFPVVRECKIYAGVDAGVYVFDKARASFSDCEMSGHANSCAALEDGGMGVFERCRFYGGRASGCHVAKRGGAKLLDCQLFSNLKAGITVAAGGRLQADRCTVQDNYCFGIWLEKDSVSIVRHCDLQRNRIRPWSIARGCRLTNEHNEPGP